MNETRNFIIWDKVTKRKYEVGTIKKGKEWVGYCPLHADQVTPNLHIEADKKIWFCFVCWRGGALYNPDFKKTDKNLITIYGYQDQDKNLICKKFRFEKIDSKGKKKKDFAFQTKNEKGNWIWGLQGIKPPLYNLPNIIKTNTVFIAEGEMDVLNLRKSFGVEATTTPFGAGHGKWLEEYNEYFKNKKVVILYDNDKVGKDFAQEEGNSLVKVAEGVKIIDLPRLKTHEDISDWIKQKHTKEEFFKLIKNTPLFESTEDKLDFSKVKFNPRHYSELINKQYILRADLLKRLWFYDSKFGIWREKGDIYLNSILRKSMLGEKDFKKYCVSEIVAHLEGLCFNPEEPEEPDLNLIPFNNLIYDIKKDKTIEYSPKYFFTSKLRVKYNPECGGCPTIDKIFHEIVRDEDVITLYEIIAYSMYRAYPYPKIMFLFGSGGNGKTAFYNILVRLFGKRNIALENSINLQYNKFSTGKLCGKFINVASEMEYSILKNTTILKQLTGEDLLDCERKFKESFPFYNYAKVIFIGNEIPETIDKTYAFYRRVLLLEFPNVFVLGKNADPDLVRNISEKEIEGLALWAIIKLRELKKRGFVFSRHEETEKIKKVYEDLSNPLAKFLEDYTEKDIFSEVFKWEFYDKFVKYLTDKGIRPWTQIALSKRMRSLGYQSKVVKMEDETNWAWLNLKWKENS